MIRFSLRAIGFGCILAAAILFFTPSEDKANKKSVEAMQQQIKSLTDELNRTKEELAIAQTASSVETVVKEETSTTNEPKIITIQRGVKSSDVAATLERMNIIKDSKAFDDYLKDHQFANKIQIGTFEVDASMDFEELAHQLTTIKP